MIISVAYVWLLVELGKLGYNVLDATIGILATGFFDACCFTELFKVLRRN